MGLDDYMDTASRLYRYSFSDQLLIHAQRVQTQQPVHHWNYGMKQNVYNQSNTEVEEEFHVQERISHIIIAITSYKIYMAVCCHVFTYVVSVRIFRI